MSAINRTFFFDYVRNHLFHGKLSQSQVDGMGAILDYWEKNYAGKDDRWLAYLLATAFHETDTKMQPIVEYGGKAYFDKRYGPPSPLAKRLGNINAGDGSRYCGRGLVQLTGRANYTAWDKRLKLNNALVNDPEMCLDVKTAVCILIDGSVLGTFTGKKLGDYFDGAKADWVNARRIINGTDKANLIAGYAKMFYAAISYTV